MWRKLLGPPNSHSLSDLQWSTIQKLLLNIRAPSSANKWINTEFTVRECNLFFHYFLLCGGEINESVYYLRSCMSTQSLIGYCRNCWVSQLQILFKAAFYPKRCTVAKTFIPAGSCSLHIAQGELQKLFRFWQNNLLTSLFSMNIFELLQLVTGQELKYIWAHIRVIAQVQKKGKMCFVFNPKVALVSETVLDFLLKKTVKSFLSLWHI